MAEYKPIPVFQAQRLAEAYGKSQVVILAYDPAAAMTHTTTYGVSPTDKVTAAQSGEECAKLICGEGFEQRTMYEDFRDVDAAKRAKRIEQATKVLRAADLAIASLLAVREGISDEHLQSIRDEIDAVLEGDDR